MMFRRMDATAIGCAKDDGATHTAPGAIANTRCVIDNLIHSGINKSHKLKFSDGSQAHNCHANRKTADHGFSQWRIANALGSKTVQQSLRGAENAAIFTDVLS